MRFTNLVPNITNYLSNFPKRDNIRMLCCLHY